MRKLIPILALVFAPLAVNAQALNTGGAVGPTPNMVAPGITTLHFLASSARRAAISNPWINPVMSSPPTVAAGTLWVKSTAYAVGDGVVTFTGSGSTSEAFFYKCTTAGTSASSGSGPSGTGTGITDGTVVWSFVSQGYGAAYSASAVNSYLWNGGAGKAGVNGPVNYLGGTPADNSATNYESTKATAYAGPLNQRFEVLTDSAAPIFRFFSYTASAYNIVVNGQFVSSTPATISHIDWQELQINFGSQKMRDIVIEPVSGTGLFGGVDVALTEGVYKPQTNDPVTIIGAGDSIIAGIGAAYIGDGFFPISCDMLGASDCIDTGIGGTGYLASSAAGTAIQRISDVLNAASSFQNPVVVDENIFNDCSGNYAAIQAAVVAYIQALRTGGFEGPIFEVDMYASNSGGSSWSQGVACGNAKLAAVQQLNDPLVFFIPDITNSNGSWFTGTGNSTSPNGTGNSDVYVNGANLPHPTDAGHLFYAKNFVNEVDQVLAGY